MTGQDLVDQLKQLGFDNTDLEILGWADERQKEMVAAARSLRKLLSIGPTVADQQAYDLDEEIAEVYELSVGGAPYGKSIHSDIGQASQADLVWVGNGLFIPTADDDGVNQVALIPVPTTSGDEITVYAACKAPTLTLGGTILIDDQYVRYLRYGAMATGWDVNAEDGNTSERYEARFEAGVERFRRYTARRFKGSGPAQIRVKGLNA